MEPVKSSNSRTQYCNNFEMLGYHDYVNCSGDGSEAEKTKFRRGIEAEVNAYCGRWARRCGINLGNDGVPQYIGNHFWYDDEPVAWSDEARHAWDQAQPTPITPAAAADPATSELIVA